MRTASPWWASLGTAGALLFMFVSERLMDGVDWLRYIGTGMGIGVILAVLAMRVWTTMSTRGARKAVERALLICQGGIAAALFFYLLSTDWGSKTMGVSLENEHKYHVAMTVLFSVVLVVSAIPLFMIEISLGTAMRDNFDIKGTGTENEEGVELFRVRDIGWSGLTVALAMSLLMVTCNVAADRNVTKDVSYFKTSSPGDATTNMVKLAPEPIRVLFFFSEEGEVKNQVRGYFEALAADTDKLVIEDHDRYMENDLAAKYKVPSDEKKGYVVLVRGKDENEKSQNIDVDINMDAARKGQSKLRNFDREVHTALYKLVRDKRRAYLTSGHGEMNDPESIPSDLKHRVPDRHATVLKKMVAGLNYELKDLGLIDMAKDVPDDATVVIMLAPSVPLQDAEWDALARYLDRGGRLLIAMDPKSIATFGPLQSKLGIKYDPASITDDKVFLPQHQTITDRRFAITTQFSAHASTTALSRAVDKGLVLIDSGSIDDAPVTDRSAIPKKTYTIKSMESSWRDYNDNYTYDTDGPKPEKKAKYNIAAALEGPKLGKDEDGKDKDGFRVLAFGDVDLFADVLVRNQMGGAGVTMVSGPLLEDSIKWLGGEDLFVGEPVSEDDKPIPHTKNQDAIWFGLTLVGAPLLVLAGGLIGTSAARRRRTPGKKGAEVKKS